MNLPALFDTLDLQVFQRGWLSSNNILFKAGAHAPSTLVDTGYASHADQTVSLIDAALNGGRLGRIVNTHLHSDHCGGNAALHARWGCEVVVPRSSFEAARRWDESALSFRATDQRCERFPVHTSLAVNDVLWLGNRQWDVYAVGGHDPDAVMLFQADAGVLISGDALWQDRVAIVFPELQGGSGFPEALATLDLIRSLAPGVVIPGHGPAFTGVAKALVSSRSRLEGFMREPQRHLDYARRSLLVFHILEHRRCAHDALHAWARTTPIFGGDGDWCASAISRLVRDGVLQSDGHSITPA